jgi:hypothetical protein
MDPRGPPPHRSVGKKRCYATGAIWCGEGPGSSACSVVTENRLSCNYVFGLALPLRPASLPEPERIEVPVAPAFGHYRRFFPREAVRHPAKANLHLIERLIELVSSPGDLLDPFAGTFSTCVVSVLMGREAVGVEIEQEYLVRGIQEDPGGDRKGLSCSLGRRLNDWQSPLPLLRRCGSHESSICPRFAARWRP